MALSHKKATIFFKKAKKGIFFLYNSLIFSSKKPQKGSILFKNTIFILTCSIYLLDKTGN